MPKRTNFRSILILTGLLGSICFFVTCIDKEQKATAQQPTPEHAPAPDNTRYSQFAGSASCTNCHHDISQTHLHTAHHLTTRAADSSNILGSKQPPANRFYYNPNLYLAVEKDSGRTFQVEYLD